MMITRVCTAVLAYAAILLTVIVVLWLGVGLVASQLSHPKAALIYERVLTATEQEQQEGYFALGDETNHDNDLVLVVNPTSDMATFLRAKVGKKIIFFIDDAR